MENTQDFLTNPPLPLLFYLSLVEFPVWLSTRRTPSFHVAPVRDLYYRGKLTTLGSIKPIGLTASLFFRPREREKEAQKTSKQGSRHNTFTDTRNKLFDGARFGNRSQQKEREWRRSLKLKEKRMRRGKVLLSPVVCSFSPSVHMSIVLHETVMVFHLQAEQTWLAGEGEGKKKRARVLEGSNSSLLLGMMVCITAPCLTETQSAD